MTTQTLMTPAYTTGVDVPDFELATAALIEARSLQQRVDRKYLLHANALPPVLARLHQGYCLLRAGEQGWARYENTYFDATGRDLYHAHRCDRRPRYKIRIRHHVERQLSFLEIKCKTNNGRTAKHRLALPYGQNHLGASERQFIDSCASVDTAHLMPCLSIAFARLTLVAKGHNERLTFDRDLTFVGGTCEKRLARIVIAEVKQAEYSNHLGAVAELRTRHVREAAFSKYCVGTILVAPVAGNVFKPALKAVERLSA